MRFQTRLFFIFLSLLVILPVFLLSTQPALASASHIVRLKDSNGNPIPNVTLILRAGEYCCDTSQCNEDHSNCSCYDCTMEWAKGPCNYDCGKYSTGPTWLATTDSHGIAVFSARAGSNSGGGIGNGDIQTCSTGRNGRLVMAVPYFSDRSGHWIFNGVNNGAADLKDDNSAETLLRTKVAGGEEKYAFTDDEGRRNYYEADWRSQSPGSQGNVASTSLSYNCSNWTGDSPGTKTTNLYWQWTWSEPLVAQNIQNEPIFAFANNLWTSFRRVIPF